MFASIPSEISLGWVYFAPFFFTVLFGLLSALALARILNATGLSRFFWHPGLAFVALWVLFTSLLGLFAIPP